MKECFAWIEECNKFIKQLEECNHVKCSRLSIGQTISNHYNCTTRRYKDLKDDFCILMMITRALAITVTITWKDLLFGERPMQFKNFNRCNNAVTRTTHRAAMIFRKHQQYSARASNTMHWIPIILHRYLSCAILSSWNTRPNKLRDVIHDHRTLQW